jgi:broad specificity phosphatase PhoE
MADLLLIRHAEVESQWKGICYGSMDVALSEAGTEASRSLVMAWNTRPQCIVHSGLERTRKLAQFFGERFPGVPILEDHRLRERNYGSWEGKSWDAIFESNPDFHDLVHRPATYRPPGGETTLEMQTRVAESFESLIKCRDMEGDHTTGPIVAISHSGPIAALAGRLLDIVPTDWTPWMIGYLESLRIQRSNASWKVDISRS